MPKLDADSKAFRAAGHKLIDWIGDYFDNIDSYDVLSRVQPGEIEKKFPAQPSEEGRSYDELLADFNEKLVPGITHWNHPAFFAYFSITGSQAGVLGELLSGAINANGMLWKTSPSLTELETLALRWLRDALGLPSNLFGIINDTASINVFLALAAARENLGLNIRGEGMTGRDLPPLRVYLSEHTHSSAEKGALALGFGQKNVVKIACDDALRMRPDALEEAIARDRANGMLPCVVVATCGTTSSAAVDPIRAIGEIANREKIWYHVDAAYAGSAMICPELRVHWDGVELADSLIFNPHKWLFTPIDCSVLYTRKPNVLRETFALVPEYLTTTDTAEINYMDYGLQLGRRFRALKLWMVLEHYGLAHLRSVIREQLSFAQRLADELRKRDGIVLLATLAYLLPLRQLSRAWFVLFASLSIVLLLAEKILLRVIARWVRSNGLNYRTTLIVGTGRRATDIAHVIEAHKYWGYKILGFVSDGHRLSNGWARYRIFGSVPDLRRILETGEITEPLDEIVFAVTRKKLDEMKQIFLLCEELGIRTRVAMNFFQNRVARIEIEELEGVPFLTFTTTPSNESQLAMKRLLDIAVSMLLLTLTFPVLALAALLIKVTSPGSVLFKQTRIGLNGRMFTLYKFRTMIEDAHALRDGIAHLNEMNGPAFKLRKDPRVTFIGRFLRKFSLDEIPQLWNVLKGDMSLVGPRPPIPEEVASYHRWHRRRLSMKPGLTCLWQVSGRNEIQDFDRWMELDLQYIDNWSPSLDLKILLRTIPAVLSGKGAS